jgi:hypothetical protein
MDELNEGVDEGGSDRVGRHGGSMDDGKLFVSEVRHKLIRIGTL